MSESPLTTLTDIDYEEAIDNYGDEIVEMAYELFITKIYKELTQKIPKAYKAKNFKELKVIFHNFKTTSKYLGAEEFSELCNKIQLCCKEGKVDEKALEKLYPLVVQNFEQLYKKCKEQYQKVDHEDNYLEDISEDTETDFKTPSSPKTPRNFKRFFSEKNACLPSEIKKPMPIFSKKNTLVRHHIQMKNELKLGTVSLIDEKLLLDVKEVNSRYGEKVCKETICNFVNNFNKDDNFVNSLRDFIDMNAYSKIREMIKSVKENLKYMITKYFEKCLDDYSEILETTPEYFNGNRIINQLEEVTGTLKEIYNLKYNENNFSFFARKTSSKKHTEVRQLEELESSNVVSVYSGSPNKSLQSPRRSPCRTQKNVAKTELDPKDINSLELLQDLDFIENMFKGVFERKDIKELISCWHKFLNFAKKYKFTYVMNKIERHFPLLNNCTKFDEIKISYEKLKEDLEMIYNEYLKDDDSLSSLALSPVSQPRDSSIILEDLKPCNFDWFFSLNINDDIFEEEEREPTKKKNNLKKRKGDIMTNRFEEEVENSDQNYNQCIIV